MSDILVILQARLSSSRLPRKVLKTLQGKPMLEHQLIRISNMLTPHDLVVATSDNVDDDAIENQCSLLNVNCYRGSLDDVLARYYNAYLANNNAGEIKHIVRLTGDCPLIDPNVIDNVIMHYLKQPVDYCSNCSPATFPDGLDVEIFGVDVLKQAYEKATKPSEREHVTSYIRNNPQLFTTSNYTHTIDLSHFRWTVDEPVDFELVTKIYQALYPTKPTFTLGDVLKLIAERPELNAINHNITRNEGLIKSEEADLKSEKQDLS
jgi:spore coat polysaccharide biosynthesis protein SpsF